MILKKGLYRLIRGAGGIALFLGILYPLRWTFFEGVVKDRIREVAREKVQSDVVFGSLEGSLLFGIEAKNIIFVPKEGSPLKKATFGEILVEYGFLGMGTPKVTINGALVMMEPPPEESVPEPPTQTESAPSKPVYKIVQSVIKELHRFESPGEFYLKDLLFVLSDGSEIDLQQAELLPTDWKVKLRADIVGRVKVEGEIGTGKAFSLTGNASKGPIRWLQIKMEPIEGGNRKLKIDTEYKGHRFAWNGMIHFEKEITPKEIEGTLVVREGKVEAKINLEKGSGLIDVDGTIPLDEDLKGDFDISGLAQGPLDGQKEAWTFSDVRISSRNFSFQKIPFEEINVRITRGSLENLVWKGNLKRKKDRLSAAGTFHWGDSPIVQSILKVNVESLAPYRKLLPELDSVEVNHLEAKGNFTYNKEGPFFDGDIQTKEGRAFAFHWNQLRSTGQVDRNSINLEGVTLTGTPIAPQIDASGLFRADGSFSGYVRTDEDQIDLAGHISRVEGIEVEYLLEGPMKWLEQFKINIPQEAQPFYFQGIATGTQNRVHIRTALVAGDLISATPQLVISRKENLWNLELSQGSVLLQGKEQIRYGKGQLQIRPGYLSLSEVPVTLEEPDLKATVWGQAEWNEETFQTDLHLREVRGWGSDLGTVRAFGEFGKESGDLQINLNWGALSGDHLMAAGVFGTSNDFTLDLRIRDLGNSALRNLLPEVPLKGAVALQVDVRQEREEIIAKGEGTLDTVSIHGSFPLSMKIPITSGNRAVAIPETTKETPYGMLTVEGKIPLPWSTYAGDLNLAATLEPH